MGVFQKMPYRPMCLVLFVFLSVFPILFFRREQTLSSASNTFADGDEIIVCGTLYKKEIKNDSVYLFVKNLSVSNQSLAGRMILVSDSDEIPYYSRIKTITRINDFSVAENDGAFDEKHYYFSQGIILRGEVVDVLQIYAPGYTRVVEGFFFWKKKLIKIYDSFFPAEEAGLMRAMCLGDKTSLDETAKTLFRDAGLSHILAVSGLHISIVGMGLFRFLRKLKCNYILSGIFSSLSVILYGCIVGFGISALRAVIMFLILMLANLLGECYDMASSWMAALIVVLCMEPVAVTNSGFLFSFGAVLGVIVIANPMAQTYEDFCKKRFEHTRRFYQGNKYKKSLMEKIISALLFSLGIQLFSLPVVASYYYVIPIYVIGLNLILIPLLSVLIGGGLLGGIMESVFGVGDGLLYICHLILYLYEFASDKSLSFPVARIVVGKPSLFKIVLYYGILFYFVYRKRIRRVATVKKWMVRVICLSLCLLFILGFYGNRKCEISMLCVGQGDGICITSKEGVVFMVDGGSSSKKNVAKYVIKPFLSYHGISKVDYWLVSHLDMDHISGLMELLEEGYNIKTVVFTKSVKNTEEETAKEHYKKILLLCEKNGTEIRYIKQGDSFGTKSLSFVCLSPDDHAYSGTNENSMVLKMSYGAFDMLFTGDIGQEQEKDMLQKKREYLWNIEVLKSAHHGSKNSNCKEWLAAISPTMTLYSAGKNNRYGHPSKETILRMEERNLDYLCTIENGQITIYPKDSGKFLINTYK